MRRTLSLLALAAVLVLSACSQDVTSSADAPKARPPLLVNSVAACTESQSVEYLQASIDSLMKFLTPNNSSAQSKFTTILNALAAGDKASAQSELTTLINFINLKYGQANTTGVTIKDPVTGVAVPIEQFKNTLIDQLTCFVALNSFDLNPGDPDKVFSNADQTAGVFFPAGYVPQGFNVVITTPSSSPLITDLDVVPSSFIDIKLVDENGDPPELGTEFNGLPIVVVCFPSTITSDVAERALLGHQAASFELLQKTNIPQMLADEVTCGANLPIQTTALGRMIRKVADFLLPEKLFASFFAFGGVGGSPEEFSPFGAVDPGMSFGGAGGSPEEFSRSAVKQQRSSARIPTASVLVGGGTTVQGVAGSPDETDPNNLPKVRIATPNGTPIDGISVTFTLSAPDASGSDPITGPDSEATLCAGATTINVPTDADGYAKVPCINFGTKVGYKNLKATFDPTDVDPLACILDAAGACAPATTSVNFLVQTTPDAPALIKTFMATPPDTTHVAALTFNYGTGLPGGVVDSAPRVIVTDQFGNPVGAGVGITWSPITGSNGAALVVGGGGSTSAGGLAQVTSWTLGLGLNQILADITGVVGTSASFTGSVPTGQSLFECPVGGNKTDIGAISFPKPNGTVRGITLYMSVTGQSSAEATYNATYTVKKNNAGGAIVGSGVGGITLPGNNGSPRTITLGLSDVVLTSETTGGVNTLWVEVAFSNLPATRKIQVWYNNSITRSNQGSCGNSLVYNPGSTTIFKRGLGINVSN